MARRLFSLVLVASIGAAAPNPRAATALAKDAERLYKDGQYLEAAKVLEEATQLEANPKLLYNLARSYDQAGEVQRALDAYRRYVSLPSTDTEPELVRRSNLSMDRLRQLVARQDADTRARDAEKERLEREAREATARADAEAEKARAQRVAFETRERAQKETKQTASNGKRTAAFVLGGVGLAALTNALIFGLVSNGSKQAFREAERVTDKRARQAATIGQAVVADLSLLIGLGCAVTAFILFPFGDGGALSLAPIGHGALATLVLSL